MDDHLSNEDYARVRAVGYAGETTRPASTLEEIANRIYAAVGRISGITDLMTDHADRLHGSEGEELAGRGGVEATPPGQISRIFQALEHLDRAVENNAYAAGRNTTIA